MSETTQNDPSLLCHFVMDDATKVNRLYEAESTNPADDHAIVNDVRVDYDSDLGSCLVLDKLNSQAVYNFSKETLIKAGEFFLSLWVFFETKPTVQLQETRSALHISAFGNEAGQSTETLGITLQEPALDALSGYRKAEWNHVIVSLNSGSSGVSSSVYLNNEKLTEDQFKQICSVRLNGEKVEGALSKDIKTSAASISTLLIKSSLVDTSGDQIKFSQFRFYSAKATAENLKAPYEKDYEAVKSASLFKLPIGRIFSISTVKSQGSGGEAAIALNAEVAWDFEFSKCLFLNRSSGRFLFRNSGMLPKDESRFTISFWALFDFSTQSETSFLQIAGKDQANNSDVFSIEFKKLSAAAGYREKAWNYWSFVLEKTGSASTIRVYLNGSEVKAGAHEISCQINKNLDALSSLLIEPQLKKGSESAEDLSETVKIAHLKLNKGALAESTILQAVIDSKDSSPLFSFPLDDISPKNDFTYDQLNKSKHAVVKGVRIASDDIFEGCMLFESEKSSFEHKRTDLLTGLEHAFTLTFWARTSGDKSKIKEDAKFLSFEFKQNGKTMGSIDFPSLNHDQLLARHDVWTHYACVFKKVGEAIEFYVNGFFLPQKDKTTLKSLAFDELTVTGDTAGLSDNEIDVRLANLRLYGKAQSLEEIIKKFQAAASGAASETFQTTHPIELSIEDMERPNVLYINDDPTPNNLFVRIKNVSRETIELSPIKGDEKSHFEIVFKPKTLEKIVGTNSYFEKLKLPSDGWTSLQKTDPKYGEVSLLLAYREGEIQQKLKPGEAFTFELQYKSADPSLGSRTTSMMLAYDNIKFVDAEGVLSGTRTEAINIVNRSGRKNLPIAATIVGSNKILNVNGVKTKIRVRLANTLEKDIKDPSKNQIKFNFGDLSKDLHTKFTVRFDKRSFNETGSENELYKMVIKEKKDDFDQAVKAAKAAANNLFGTVQSPSDNLIFSEPFIPAAMSGLPSELSSLNKGVNDLMGSLSIGDFAAMEAFNLRVEAVNYKEMSGIGTGGCDDRPSKTEKSVGYVDSGDWVSYEVTLPSSGDYKINYRIASGVSSGAFRTLLINESNNTSFIVRSKGSDVVAVPNTGGFQNWANIEQDMRLESPGKYTLKLEFVGSGVNLHYFDIKKVVS